VADVPSWPNLESTLPPTIPNKKHKYKGKYRHRNHKYLRLSLMTRSVYRNAILYR
jgi:hypothetical protein